MNSAVDQTLPVPAGVMATDVKHVLEALYVTNKRQKVRLYVATDCVFVCTNLKRRRKNTAPIATVLRRVRLDGQLQCTVVDRWLMLRRRESPTAESNLSMFLMAAGRDADAVARVCADANGEAEKQKRQLIVSSRSETEEDIDKKRVSADIDPVQMAVIALLDKVSAGHLSAKVLPGAIARRDPKMVHLIVSSAAWNPNSADDRTLEALALLSEALLDAAFARGAVPGPQFFNFCVRGKRTALISRFLASTPSEHWTDALSQALATNNVKLAHLILRNHNLMTQTLFTSCCRTHNVELVACYIQEFASTQALKSAIDCRDLEIVSLFSTDRPDVVSLTCCLTAVEYCDVEIFVALLNETVLERIDGEKLLKTLLAARPVPVSFVQVMLNLGVLLPYENTGELLNEAVAHNNVVVADILIRHQPECIEAACKITAADETDPPLHTALNKHHYDIARLLVDAKDERGNHLYDLHLEDKYHSHALDAACYYLRQWKRSAWSGLLSESIAIFQHLVGLDPTLATNKIEMRSVHHEDGFPKSLLAGGAAEGRMYLLPISRASLHHHWRLVLYFLTVPGLSLSGVFHKHPGDDPFDEAPVPIAAHILGWWDEVTAGFNRSLVTLATVTRLLVNAGADMLLGDAMHSVIGDASAFHVSLAAVLSRVPREMLWPLSRRSADVAFAAGLIPTLLRRKWHFSRMATYRSVCALLVCLKRLAPTLPQELISYIVAHVVLDDIIAPSVEESSEEDSCDLAVFDVGHPECALRFSKEAPYTFVCDVCGGESQLGTPLYHCSVHEYDVHTSCVRPVPGTSSESSSTVAAVVTPLQLRWEAANMADLYAIPPHMLDRVQQMIAAAKGDLSDSDCADIHRRIRDEFELTELVSIDNQLRAGDAAAIVSFVYEQQYLEQVLDSDPLSALNRNTFPEAAPEEPSVATVVMPVRVLRPHAHLQTHQQPPDAEQAAAVVPLHPNRALELLFATTPSSPTK